MTKKIWAAVGLLGLIMVAGVALIVIPAPAEAPATIEMQGTLSGRVVVDIPAAGESVPKAFSVSGSVPGPWYFEASFPIEVRNQSGAVVGSGVAQADGEWMTENNVPFSATVTVSSYSGPATLILKRDNPSDLPENDASVSVPIVVQ